MDAVVERRGLPKDSVADAIAAAPLSAAQAMQRGLVDRLCYYDQVLETINQGRSDAALPAVDFEQYVRATQRDHDGHASVLSQLVGALRGAVLVVIHVSIIDHATR